MKKINNSKVMAGAPLLAVCALAASSCAEKPNVVMIYVDDMGVGDISCYNGTLVETPNIDFLANNGIKLTQAYVMAPVSAASRVGLMSGSYPTRLGMDANNGKCFTIDEGHHLLPEAFKMAGYTTGISGKWNVLVNPDTNFEFIRHRINFAATYWPDAEGVYHGVDNNLVPIHTNGRWEEATEDNQYLTDMIFDSAAEFIRQNRESKNPFFLYAAPNAPHYPLQAKLGDYDRVAHIENPAYRTYAAMLLALDDNIGKLLDALRETGKLDNTIICFASDNGPSTASSRRNTDMGAGQSTWFWPEDWPTGLMFWSTNGMRGSKGSLYEGGIRLPLIFYYPRKIKPGTASDEIVANMDVYPTLCSLCGIHVPSTTKLDGIDISRLLTGKAKKSPHDYIYWKIRDQGAVRHGDWKLYFDKKGIELYNIREDINETNDLSSTYPEMTGELKSLWDKWYAQYEYVFTPLNAQ